jgi:aryl-alcohol dehydrogenase-like predicted oxidoreductase
MISLIRIAVDRGQVVIATKFGWDIDPVERKPRGGSRAVLTSSSRSEAAAGTIRRAHAVQPEPQNA